MSIDTAAKRASCIGFGLVSLRTGCIPDGSDLSAAQRLHATYLYSGISASSPDAFQAGNLLVFTHADPGKVFRITDPGKSFTLTDPGKTFRGGGV